MKTIRASMNVAVVFAVLMLMGSYTNAQQGRHYGDRPMREGYGRGYEYHAMNPNRNDQLDLTDEQKGKIDEIKLATSKKSIQRQNKINELEAQLRTSITQDIVDKNKVNTLIDEIGKLKAENRKDRMDDHLKIRELLTDKQKVIFDQRRSGRY